ncbi:cell wall anchor [Limosilactobacillus reuteri]|uniref:Cell wall anchor n=1 Tax=Limosilactobacillus reuteri TaxID=1598 RepID=A0A2S1ER61_LIMRT|nr:LPXTG cell wall anchor domain-containing protein [Limosilactobacillus reuteri]AWD62407.1 cell wall anchor [Limosilactobacillus reuteri]
MNHLNHHCILQNTCLVGLTTASTILSLSLNTPPVLAATQESITYPVSNANNQKERVQIKRVIYFHLLNEVKKVEQVSYAHREVPNDPTKKAIWIIEPFEEVNIPDQAGFRPSMDKIPTVTEIEDLSQLKSIVNIYYQPLNKDEGTKKENILEEKKAAEQATENEKEEKQGSQDNYSVEEDLGDDNQVGENYGEVNNTRKQQNLHQRIKDINNRLNRSHRNSRKNDSNDQQTLPQTGNETDNLTTFLGLGITVMVAGMSLFLLKKAHNKK